MLNHGARITKDGRRDGAFALSAGAFFFFRARVLSAAYLNFYSAVDRLTDELTDSIDVDTAPKEGRARGRLKANLGGSLPMRDKSPGFCLNQYYRTQ